MAGLSPAELRKRNNFSLFRTRIASRGDFTLVESNGKKVKIDPTVANTLRSVDDLFQYQVGQSIVLPTTLILSLYVSSKQSNLLSLAQLLCSKKKSTKF